MKQLYESEMNSIESRCNNQEKVKTRVKIETEFIEYREDQKEQIKYQEDNIISLIKLITIINRFIKTLRNSGFRLRDFKQTIGKNQNN
ncbi:unnamed protein product [Paramecium sonneborni]|uniref:Uncharacterized protein n=1 Tax=Paramecium sonneborni TaxID=65129 RepID=A0A8S1MJR4_9CILI|nr:unnamed protein product [Paramecium sonneborni]